MHTPAVICKLCKFSIQNKNNKLWSWWHTLYIIFSNAAFILQTLNYWCPHSNPFLTIILLLFALKFMAENMIKTNILFCMIFFIQFAILSLFILRLVYHFDSTLKCTFYACSIYCCWCSSSYCVCVFFLSFTFLCSFQWIRL